MIKLQQRDAAPSMNAGQLKPSLGQRSYSAAGSTHEASHEADGERQEHTDRPQHAAILERPHAQKFQRGWPRFHNVKRAVHVVYSWRHKQGQDGARTTQTDRDTIPLSLRLVGVRRFEDVARADSGMTLETQKVVIWTSSDACYFHRSAPPASSLCCTVECCA